MVKIRREDLEQIARRTNENLERYKAIVAVCTSTGCKSAGSFDVLDKFQKEIESRGIDDKFLIMPTGCLGLCGLGPLVLIQPDGVLYHSVNPDDVPKIVERHLIGGEFVDELLYRDLNTGKTIPKIKDIPFYSKQQLLVLRNLGLIDPENIDHYIARGGYSSLRKALNEMKPDEIIDEVTESAIRGRGGAGFPTGIKWKSARKYATLKNEKPYVVCNLNEGDPGAFMDSYLVESNPHAIIEGMIIGAYAIGAREGYIYMRNDRKFARSRLEKALAQAKEYGLLGENIMESDFSFDIEIHRGAGAYVCGESTALMRSMTGRVGEPRSKYIHNVEFGLHDKPTVLNNVETWSNIPLIIEKGGKWFASIGTGNVTGENPWSGSSGTKALSLVGDVKYQGLVEVPMGMTLRELIFDIGGGIPNGRKFKAVQTGGPSGACFPESMLDLPLDYNSMVKAGSIMVSGGVVVMDDSTCMVDIAKYYVEFLMEESCGKCTPCREGLFHIHNILTRITTGQGQEGDIELIEEIAKTIGETSLCQLGGAAPNPILSSIKYFRDEYEAHIKEKICPANVCNFDAVEVR